MTADLGTAIGKVEDALQSAKLALGDVGDVYEPGYFEKHRVVMSKCAEHLTQELAARITTDWNGARVRMVGISSTSTSGLQGALHNWMAAARRRLPA